jgi:hypothetical protein
VIARQKENNMTTENETILPNIYYKGTRKNGVSYHDSSFVYRIGLNEHPKPDKSNTVYSSGIHLAKDDAERVLGSTIDVNEPSNLMRRRAFLKLPIEKRRQLLEQQAKALFDYYENEAEILTAEDGIYDY